MTTLHRSCCWRLVALSLPALAAIACDRSRAEPPAAADAAAAAEAIPVAVEPIERRSLSSLYSTSATLRADRQATVIARTKGVIHTLGAEEGDRVSEGQPLATLENDEQRIEAERARLLRDTAQRDFERVRNLRQEGVVSEEQFERLRREAAESAHTAELAELVLSRTVIRAPFAGVVVRRHLDVGATVADGTPVFDLADVTPLYADVFVPERHIPRLRPGQSVRLVADAGGAAAEGGIERIAPAVDPETGTVKVTVAVAGGAGMRPGSFARVEIVTDTRQGALVVPRSALVAEGRRWSIFRVPAGSDAAERLEVRIGFEEGDLVEIAEVLTGRPLEVGDPVVVVGASALSDGAPVTVSGARENAAADGAS